MYKNIYAGQRTMYYTQLTSKIDIYGTVFNNKFQLEILIMGQ